MALNVNYLELFIKSNGFLRDEYSDLIITKFEDIPTNLLLIHIKNYSSHKNQMNTNMIAMLEVNYHVYYNEIFPWACFVNNNCNYHVYSFWGTMFYKYVSHPCSNFNVRSAIDVDVIVADIKGPCIIYDTDQYFETYEKSMTYPMITEMRQNAQNDQNSRRVINHIDKIHKHFILRPIEYYNNGLQSVTSTTNVTKKYCCNFYIMDVKANFVTKSAVKTVK